MRRTLGLFRTVLVLLQATLQSDPSVLTLFKDVLVLVLGQDSIVGLDVVLLEHSLVAIVYQSMSLSCRVGCGEVYLWAVHHGGSVTVLCVYV